MKTSLYFNAICGLISAAVLSVSCQKESVESKYEVFERNLKSVTLTVGLPSDDTKISSSKSDVTKIQWNSVSEHLGVIAKSGGKVKYYKFSSPGGSSSLTAEFSCDSVDDDAQLLFAVYPFESYNNDDNPWDGTSESIPLTVLTDQNCSALMGISANAPLVSRITGTSISLKHVCGYLKLNIPERCQRLSKEDGSATKPSSDLKKVVISSTSPLAGKIGVSFNEDGSIKNINATEATEKTISCLTKEFKSYNAAGSQDSDSGWTPGYMFIPIIPGTYSDFDFELIYRTDINGNAVNSYTAHSAGTNVFTPGVAIGGTDGIILSGPFVQSLNMTEVAHSSTTLSMSGTATIWTYSKVTSSDYVFKFCYREVDSSDSWLEAAAIYSNGTVTGSATVDDAKSYEVKLKIVAAGVTYESAVIKEAAPGDSITFEFSGSTPSYGTFSYLTPGPSEVGYHICVDADGNPIFPKHEAGVKAGRSFLAKEWDGTAFGDVISIDISAVAPAKTLGMTLVKDGYTVIFENNENYYTIYTQILCISKQFIRLVCPAGKKIIKVVPELDAGSKERSMTAGLGKKKDDRSIVKDTKVEAPGTENPKDNKSIDLTVPTPAVDTDLWLYLNSRCNRFTIYYE